ncbi:MAG: S9 family peptidase [Lewinellaceae bacterium]|nr:S9 family peptidase [Saprospiraceae bacterium]MCB9313116.1 S9 family peptidase [Lewinellaceae bacterium]
MRFFLVFLLLFGCASPNHFLLAQQPITLESIFLSSDLVPRDAGAFQFLADGRSYTRLRGNAIHQYDLASGKRTEVLFEGGAEVRIQSYSLSADETRILIETDQERVYRYSRRSTFLVYDRGSQTLYPVSGQGKQMHATLSPDGTQVAFVRENNLFISDYTTGIEIQVTHDGEVNQVINGSPDWVYEEEFKLVRAFEWSPDGTRLAYYRFDESRVPEFTMTLYNDDLYPEYVSYKYPKVGQTLSTVSIHVFDLASGRSVEVDLGENPPVYIPRMAFTRDPDQLCVTLLNREQNRLELRLADVGTGTSRTLFSESNAAYLRIHDHLRFLQDGRHFLWASEQDGWYHLYLYDMEGNLVRQLTSGTWEVTDVYGVDEERRVVWFQAAGRSPREREICRISLDGGQVEELPGPTGFQEGIFSTTFDYLIRKASTINTPPVYEVLDRDGKVLRAIEDNQDVVQKQREHGVQPVSFFDFMGPDETRLHGWMIKPAAFDPAKTYPVLMYVYGGPGYQEVTDEWIGQRYWWFQMLASQGMIIAAVDGRGGGARGEAFRKITYRQLGHYETIDQIAAARYLGSLSYVDADRIAIYGGSYGGYLSSLCLFKGHDVFRAGIAVSPVTNWKWYDAIYTERYMGTEADNPEGYRENSPVYFADLLEGDYLLIHGMADDNVHFQNTAEMTKALVAANKPFETYVYTNQAHSISGGNARIHLYTRMTNFLRESLGLGDGREE